MSGKKGGFITGANAMIKLGGVTLAYCTDVGYNVTIQTIPVEAMGRYEVYSNEPVSYTVDGTLSVIRYTARAAENHIENAAAGGNGSPSVQTTLDDPTQSLQNHSTPGLMLGSSTFDVEIHEKQADASGYENGIEAGNNIKVVSIKDCRLTRRGMTLNKRGLYVDQYAFVGMLVADAKSDGSDFEHVGSGVGTDLAKN